MARKRTNKRVDNRVFKKTAGRTLKVNLPHKSRGGTCL